MEEINRFVVFKLDEQQFALYLSSVKRIAHAVEVTPLPKAPDIVMGVINLQGQIVPVVNIRKRFRFPERRMELSDYFVIGRTPERLVAILVDDIGEIVEISKKKVINTGQILPGIDYIKGAVKVEGNIVLIHDLDRFLSLEEEQQIDEAIKHTKNAKKPAKKVANRTKSEKKQKKVKK